MTPAARAHATADALNDLAGSFLLDPKTHERGAELGFPGVGFDIVGRAGVLGRAAPDVVAAALVFFHPAVVTRVWTAGLEVMDPRDVSAVFAATAHSWARRLPDRLDLARLAGLAGRVVSEADAAGAPLFAGWRAMPEPEDPKAIALHRLCVLRELRAAHLAIGVLAAGVAPREAVVAADPGRAVSYGWPPVALAGGDRHERLGAAREIGGRLLDGALSALDESERGELDALTAEALAAARSAHHPTGAG